MAAPRASLEALNVGDMFLKKYQIQGLIGRGGQATVYQSHDTYIDREVAIKIMADAMDTKREHSRRAQMEARVLCKFHHPNIVHVYDAGTTDSGMTSIIMELLKGRTLREVLRHFHKLTVHEALSLGAQIADGVEIAHRQQVIHRDLKPENIFIVNANTVKVLDFGIAKFLTLTGITTQRDTLQGTMWYISPEHVQGVGVTARSDIYALGSILYEAISGTPPCLMGLQEITTQSVAWSQISRMPPQLDVLMPGVPSLVARLIQRMLLKEADRRYGSMAEVAELLRNACKQLSEGAGSSGIVLRDLWYAGQDKSQEAGFGILAAPDAPNETRVPTSKRPTVDVKQMVKRAASATVPMRDDPTVSAPVHSGFNAPRLSAGADEAVGDVSAAAGSAPEQSKSPTIRRWQIVAIAVALGTVIGIALGFSRRIPLDAKNCAVASAQLAVEAKVSLPANSPVTQVMGKTATTATGVASASGAASANPQAQSSPVASGALRAASNGSESIPSVVTTTNKDMNFSPSKGSPGSNAKQPRSKTPASSSDNRAAKSPASGPKPPYGGEDLE